MTYDPVPAIKSLYEKAQRISARYASLRAVLIVHSADLDRYLDNDWIEETVPLLTVRQAICRLPHIVGCVRIECYPEKESELQDFMGAVPVCALY